MTLRTIFVPTASKLDLIGPLDAALSIARPLCAHIDVLYVMQSAVAVLSQFPETARVLDADLIERESREMATRTKDRFHEWCSQNGLGHTPEHHLLGSTFARWKEEEQELQPAVARAGRLADIIVVSRPEISNVQSSQCFDAAVFASGRPTLIASKSAQGNPLRHVLIAWNGSLEATHAISSGIDVLHAAEQVSIFSVSEDAEASAPGLELADALRWHGVESTVLQNSHGAESIGESLLGTARRHHASLILMGAYTHSRIREMLLGGVTRHVLRRCDLPVMMAH